MNKFTLLLWTCLLSCQIFKSTAEAKPNPEPDPDININVVINVNGDKECDQGSCSDDVTSNGSEEYFSTEPIVITPYGPFTSDYYTYTTWEECDLNYDYDYYYDCDYEYPFEDYYYGYSSGDYYYEYYAKERDTPPSPKEKKNIGTGHPSRFHKDDSNPPSEQDASPPKRKKNTGNGSSTLILKDDSDPKPERDTPTSPKEKKNIRNGHPSRFHKDDSDPLSERDASPPKRKKNTGNGRSTSILEDDSDPKPERDTPTSPKEKKNIRNDHPSRLHKDDSDPPSDCGGEFNASSGTIRHPFSGGYYQTNEDCSWTIRASAPIDITFITFSLEYDFDFLFVYDGESSNKSWIGTFTGCRGIPSVIQTSTGAAYINFYSDSMITSTGFELTWELSEL